VSRSSPRPCTYCKRQVLWLPTAQGRTAWITVELEMGATTEVAEAARWAWVKGRGLVPLQHRVRQPERCLVRHFCDEFHAARLGHRLADPAEYTITPGYGFGEQRGYGRGGG
jgi:hypothetical protein